MVTGRMWTLAVAWHSSCVSSQSGLHPTKRTYLPGPVSSGQCDRFGGVGYGTPFVSGVVHPPNLMFQALLERVRVGEAEVELRSVIRRMPVKTSPPVGHPHCNRPIVIHVDEGTTRVVRRRIIGKSSIDAG